MKKMLKKLTSLLVTTSMLLAVFGVFTVYAGDTAVNKPEVYYSDDFSSNPQSNAMFSLDSRMSWAAGETSAISGDLPGIIQYLGGSNGGDYSMGMKVVPSKEIHNFANNNSKTVLEIKARKSLTGNVLKVFRYQDGSNYEPSEPLVQFNDNGITFRANDGNKPIAEGITTNKWYHIFVVLTGDQAVVYMDGTRYPADTGSYTVKKDSATGIKNGVIIASAVWNWEDIRLDDCIIQSLGNLMLQKSRLASGKVLNDLDENIPISNKDFYLDFNTIIDENPTNLEKVKVYKNGSGVAESGVSVTRVAEDTTRIKVAFTNPLDYNATYKIDYTGLVDKMDTPTTASGDITFKTVEGTPKLLSSTPQQNLKEVDIKTGGAQMEFSVELDPDTVNPTNVTVTPAINTYSVQLTGSDNRIVNVDFGTALLTNTTYTITLSDVKSKDNGGIAVPETDNKISFTTSPTPDYHAYRMESLSKIANPNLVSTLGFTLSDYDNSRGGGYYASLAHNGGEGSGRGWRPGDPNGKIVYKLDEGIRNARILYAETGGNNKTSMTFKYSTDGSGSTDTWSSITGYKCVGVGVDSNGTMYKEDNSTNPGWKKMYYEVNNLPAGTKYLEVTMAFDPVGEKWKTELYQMTFNYNDIPIEYIDRLVEFKSGYVDRLGNQTNNNANVSLSPQNAFALGNYKTDNVDYRGGGYFASLPINGGEGSGNGWTMNAGEIVYRLDSTIKNAKVFYSENGDAQITMTFQTSVNGSDWGAVLTPSKNGSGYMKKEDGSESSWQKYNYEVDNLPVGTKYLKIIISAADTKNWNRELYQLAFNYNDVNPKLLSSTPDDEDNSVTPANKITLNFDSMIYKGSMQSTDFTLTGGVSIDNIAVSADYKTITLTLNKAMDYGSEYTLDYDLTDLYGRAVNGSISFVTKLDFYVTGAYLIDSGDVLDPDADEVSYGAGTFVPRFIVTNNTQGNMSGAFVFAMYNGNQLEKAVTFSNDNIISGTNQIIDLDEITINASETAYRYEFFAWDGFNVMRPLKWIETDNGND